VAVPGLKRLSGCYAVVLYDYFLCLLFNDTILDKGGHSSKPESGFRPIVPLASLLSRDTDVRHIHPIRHHLINFYPSRLTSFSQSQPICCTLRFIFTILTRQKITFILFTPAASCQSWPASGPSDGQSLPTVWSSLS